MNQPAQPWCCTGYNSECPLCPEYGTRLTDPCPGHPVNDNTQSVVDTARLHAERRHPDFEYATTEGPRKQWDAVDDPPRGDDGLPDASWESNVDAGRPGLGWDRFDYTEEAYWRRRKQPSPAPSATTAACAVLHTDGRGNIIPCPGYPHANPAELTHLTREQLQPIVSAMHRREQAVLLGHLVPPLPACPVDGLTPTELATRSDSFDLFTTNRVAIRFRPCGHIVTADGEDLFLAYDEARAEAP